MPISISSDFARYGDNSLKIQATGTPQFAVQPEFTVVTGRRSIVFDFDYFLHTLTAGVFTVKVRFYNSSEVEVGTPRTVYTCSTSSTQGRHIQRAYNLRDILPDTANRIKLSIGIDGAGATGVAYVDAVSIRFTNSSDLTGGGSSVSKEDLELDEVPNLDWTQEPNAPASLSITEQSSGAFQLTIGLSTSPSAEISRYEVWSSIGDDSHYGLLSIVNQEDIGAGDSTLTINDTTFDYRTTVYYKVYAVYQNAYSTAVTGSRASTHNVADASNVQCLAGPDTFTLHYDLPDDPFFDDVSIYVDANTVEASLSESTAIAAGAIYTGTRTTYVYTIPEADVDKYHKFWIVTGTRT